MDDEYRKTMELLAATVVHEVKNPLSLLKANIDYMQLCDTDKKYEKNYVLMNNQLQKASLIITSFVMLMQNGCDDYEILDLYDMVDEAVCDYNDIPMKNIYISINFSELDLAFLGNSKLFPIVLSNILKNAVEAIEHSGHIDVTATSDCGLIYLTISDNGCGIPLETLKKLNENHGFTTKENGNGLGIIMCRKIIIDCGGTFNIESEQSKGTRIKITLPRYNRN